MQRGDRRGRQIGFRTLNLAAPTDAVGDGVWAGWVRVGEGDRGITLAAAVSIGTRATFYSDGGERLVEAHLPACFGDLYGRTVTVAMCTHLRGQRAFGTVDELVAQLRRDVDATLEWWRAATSDPTNPNPGAHMNITILVGNPKPQSRTRQVAETLVETVFDLTGERPTMDFALVLAARLIGLPPEAPLAVFALGRSVGWMAHVMEQYAAARLIRPRARYVGPQP